MLGAVGVVLAMLILPYFQKWLIQRSEIEAARAQVAQSQRDVADLQRQRDRWLDSDYIKSQARLRLDYVMPGDIGYVVSDPESDVAAEDSDSPTTRAVVEDRPWFSDLWLSAQVAADPDGTGGTGAGQRAGTR